MKYTLHLIWAMCLILFTACDDDEIISPPKPDPPVRGSRYVTVLDQDGQRMTGCTFDFEVDEAVLEEDRKYAEMYGDTDADAGTESDAGTGSDAGLSSYNERSLLVYGKPRHYDIPTECGKLNGYVSVDLNRGENEELETRLIDSFCSRVLEPDVLSLVADADHPVVNMHEDLGLSSETRCTNWFESPDWATTEVANLLLDCAGRQNCDPVEGRNYLISRGSNGEVSLGVPLHLSLTAQVHRVPEGEEYTVWVTLRQMEKPWQELQIPVRINGKESEGTEGTGDVGDVGVGDVGDVAGDVADAGVGDVAGDVADAGVGDVAGDASVGDVEPIDASMTDTNPTPP